MKQTRTATPCRVGILGCGHMGSALAEGLSKAHGKSRLFSLQVYANHPMQQQAMDRLGILRAASAHDLANGSDILVIAVKPEQVCAVTSAVAPAFYSGHSAFEKLLVSVAAGISLPTLELVAGPESVVARVMPDTLCAIGKGAFGVCLGSRAEPWHKAILENLFGAIGHTTFFAEEHMNAFTALAGCGPGLLFHIMDSLVEAGVSIGLNRGDSRNIAAMLMGGCGEWATSTGRSPADLREQSTSPSGMTIAGLNHLDRTAVRGHLIDAVKAALRRGQEMGT